MHGFEKMIYDKKWKVEYATYNIGIAPGYGYIVNGTCKYSKRTDKAQAGAPDDQPHRFIPRKSMVPR